MADPKAALDAFNRNTELAALIQPSHVQVREERHRRRRVRRMNRLAAYFRTHCTKVGFYDLVSAAADKGPPTVVIEGRTDCRCDVLEYAFGLRPVCGLKRVRFADGSELWEVTTGSAWDEDEENAVFYFTYRR